MRFVPSGSTWVSVFAVAVAAAAVFAAVASVAQQPQPSPTFDILEFQIEGNSVLSVREIERAVTPFLGLKKRFEDVEGARKALEDTYQKSGYQTVFVDIPEQKVVGGVIRLRVAEGRVDRLRVTGSRHYELGEIRSRAESLAPGSVPDFNQVQQDLAQLNRMPDRQVSPILTPGSTPGTIDVDLSVKDRLPLHGDLEVDNYASPFTTNLRTNASLHYDNLWQAQHSLALNYQVAPEKPSEANVIYATYLWRFQESDDAISVYGIRSNSDVAVVGSSTILGNAKIAGVRWVRPIGSGMAGSSSYFNSITFGIDRKDFAQTNVSALTGQAAILPQVTYTPLSLTYGGTLVSEAGTAQVSFGVTTAPRGFFGNSDAAFRGRRVLGDASWVAWKLDASIERWLAKPLSGFAKFGGQWTTDPLIPNEQFITGGADSVRGYRESEISGDRGFHATMEMRWYPIGRPSFDGRHTLYVLAFVDGAQVQLVDPAGPQIPLTSIASAGLGVRVQGWYGIHGALDLARTLRNGGHGVDGFITPSGVNRVDASLGVSF